jgi:hypothetical protein
MRPTAILSLFACLGGCSDDQRTSPQRIASYESTDPCSSHADESSCSTDTGNGCSWINLGLACPADTECPSGVCQQLDACRTHDDAASCTADPGCDWAAVELCPADGETCPEGFCYTKADGCACVCPLYCPAGADCPPCECDCPPDGGGGGDDCTCACPSCLEGESCPPCDCSCDGGGSGGSCGEDTCTCTCPSCAAGEECPPCTCDCGPSEDPPETCVCPSCPAGESCPPCSCDGAEADDPCQGHTEEAACLADTVNECQWYAIGAPCIEGEPCRSGVCQGPTDPGGGGGGGGCTCVCPDCAPGETCPPCDCGTGDGGGGDPGLPDAPDAPPPA